jgi:flagellar FliL protein
MPDDEKTIVGAADGEAKAPDGDAKRPSPLKKIGLYGIIALVLVAAAYFVTLKVVKPMLAGGGSAKVSEPEKKEAPKPKAREAKERKGESEETAGAQIYKIEDIIVNPAGTGGTRFLSTSIGFELGSQATVDLFTEREAIVRDALITILSSQSIPELSDAKQRELLRQLIQTRVQKLLETEDVAAVYFTEFVLQ